MKSICYLVPYFGRLPQSCQMWLLSCEGNPSIDWILMTDDRTPYQYPTNVRVFYCSFDEMVERISNYFDFPVAINKPWKLCDFRPAYGEIFQDELKEYDFWGHCDMDMIWGDIRQFITEDVLNKYEKIGFQGHSTLYKNTPNVNSRYKKIFNGFNNYREVFGSNKGYCFDENGICDIYNAMKIPYYDVVNFAHLVIWTNSFFLGHLPKEENFKNRRQIFIWRDGKLKRLYLEDGSIREEEFMYLHTFMRPITYKIDEYKMKFTYAVYPDIVKRISPDIINYNFINSKGKCSALRYYLKLAYRNRKKLTVKKVWVNFKNKIRMNSEGRYK